MTWLGDPNSKLSDSAREKLLDERDTIEKQIKDLSVKPISKSAAAVQGRREDLLALAKKIKAIDKKLGRNP